jgi:hypothetical protein
MRRRSRADAGPAQVYVLYDDTTTVRAPRWLLALGSYRLALAARDRWGADSVVVAPLTEANLRQALRYGRVVVLAVHGTGGAIYTRPLMIVAAAESSDGEPAGYGIYVADHVPGKTYQDGNPRRVAVGQQVQLVYNAACEGGHSTEAWEQALAPAEVVTFNRLSAVGEPSSGSGSRGRRACAPCLRRGSAALVTLPPPWGFCLCRPAAPVGRPEIPSTREATMRPRSWMAVLLGVLFAAASSPVTAGDEAPQAKGAVAPKWEYQALSKEQVVAHGKKDLAAGLNKLGDDGWELVAVVPEGRPERRAGQATFYFKRPARQAEAAQPGAGEFKVIRLKNLSAVQTAKILQELLGADGKRCRIVAEPVTNQILVNATPIDLITIAKILDLLDVPADK